MKTADEMFRELEYKKQSEDQEEAIYFKECIKQRDYFCYRIFVGNEAVRKEVNGYTTELWIAEVKAAAKKIEEKGW